MGGGLYALKVKYILLYYGGHVLEKINKNKI